MTQLFPDPCSPDSNPSLRAARRAQYFISSRPKPTTGDGACAPSASTRAEGRTSMGALPAPAISS
jgi:hypothetical protein